ncbi:MAG: P-loop NTPase fold protein [Acidobacteriota bacterium]|nr:P-loop NTPase fold protein [Acidobacteriota bacterium]
MATLISPSVALTVANHVENHQGYFLDWDRTIGTPTDRIEATVITRDPAIDFAALELEPTLETSLPSALLAMREPEITATWECLFVSPFADEPVRRSGTIGGIETFDGRRYLKLLPSDLSDLGLTPAADGAPVMVGNQLVGIMAPVDLVTPHWRAVPLAEMMKSPQWQQIAELIPSVTGSQQRERTAEFDSAAFLKRLSSSSRTALEHANGIRSAQGQEKIHMEHLIAGLFQKENGPTHREFRRAGIDDEKLAQIAAEEVGIVLPTKGTYTPASVTELPPLSTHVYQALVSAAELADAKKSKLIRSRHLIRGALSVSVCSLINALLSQGVDPEKILLDDPLKQPTPRRPTQAGIKSDDPEGEDLLDIKAEVEALCTVLASKDVKPPISLGLFGEWGSGKSFFMKKMETRFNELKQVAQKGDSAYCANIVQLWFNAWHYMDTNLWASLATEIFDELAQELARQDAVTAGKDPDYERAQLVAQRAKADEAVTEAEQKKRDADAKVRASEVQLASIQSSETEVAMDPQAVLREGYRFAVQQPEVRATVVEAENALNRGVEDAAKALNMDSAPRSVKEQLLQLQGIWGYVQAIALAVRNTKSKRRWLLSLGAFLVIVVSFVWLLPLVLGQDWIHSAWLRITGVGLALVGALSPFIPVVHRAVQIIHDAIKSNQESIEKARLEAEKKLQLEHQQLQQRANEAQTTLETATTNAKEVTEKLDNLRSDRQMSNFIRQRQKSSDYTRYLGVIAKARSDFEQLSTLLAKEQERSAKEQEERRKKKQQAATNVAGQETQAKENEWLLPRIDRIILYIDDLDRCPEHKVVDVLQAVHLLLAFPLFIVVVGVDPRWLLHSLRQHSTAFQNETAESNSSEEERTHWQSTPLNYLEKIFQIPFTLWPMGKSGFGKMVDTLTEPPRSEKMNGEPEELAGTKTEIPPAKAKPEGADTGANFPVKDRLDELLAGDAAASAGNEVQINTTVLESSTISEQTQKSDSKSASQAAPQVIDPHPAHLQIESWERDFMKELHQLIPSPRATKRFINVYRLIRASVDLDEKLMLDEFTGDANQGKYQAVLLLLAILTGYPDQATEILRELVEKKHPETWWQFIETFKGRAEKRQAAQEGKAAADTAAQPRTEGAVATGTTASKSGAEKARASKRNGRNGNPATQDEAVGNTFSDAEAESWQQLLEKLDNLRHRIEPSQSCDDFVDWAPKVARYSFQSGRILLTRSANSPEGEGAISIHGNDDVLSRKKTAGAD